MHILSDKLHLYVVNAVIFLKVGTHAGVLPTVNTCKYMLFDIHGICCGHWNVNTIKAEAIMHENTIVFHE